MKNILIVFILFSLLIVSCTQESAKTSQRKVDLRKPMSWGNRQDIYVFADDNVWKYAEHYIRKSLERFQFTTENESVFIVKRTPMDKMEQFYKFNNLLFLADLSSDEPVAAYVKKIMGSQVEAEVTEKSVGIYPQNNVWSRDQFVLFLLADNEEKLLKLNIEMANSNFELFEDVLFDRINAQVYRTKPYLPDTFQTYTWEMQLPKSYVPYKQDGDFISFLARLRNKPDRYISVYSQLMENNEVDTDWLKKTRADLAWKYFDEDEFFDKDIRFERYEHRGFEGWKISGRWQNKKYAVGGAFQSFAFFDAASKKAYLIDNSIYFPEGFKLAGLIEMEVISRTLKIKEN
jgi:5-bromo-4-chloroindolyl phosphate hydrolysis protein